MAATRHCAVFLVLITTISFVVPSSPRIPPTWLSVPAIHLFLLFPPPVFKIPLSCQATPARRVYLSFSLLGKLGTWSHSCIHPSSLRVQPVHSFQSKSVQSSSICCFPPAPIFGHGAPKRSKGPAGAISCVRVHVFFPTPYIVP